MVCQTSYLLVRIPGSPPPVAVGLRGFTAFRAMNSRLPCFRADRVETESDKLTDYKPPKNKQYSTLGYGTVPYCKYQYHQYCSLLCRTQYSGTWFSVFSACTLYVLPFSQHRSHNEGFLLFLIILVILTGASPRDDNGGIGRERSILS